MTTLPTAGGRRDIAARTVLVTGGASGMGAATAREFAAQGATLILADLDRAGAERVAEECQSLGAGTVSVAVGDVSRSDFCDETVNTAVESHGSIDVLVTAAGTIHRADSLGTSDADWQRVMGVNIDGMFSCAAQPCGT